MSRRLEIELTSQRADGSWTWRAAGARQPKGEVSAELVPDTAAVGTVLKAEADGGLDGLEITALSAPRVRAAPTDRLELITGGDGPLVTTKLAPKSRRSGTDDRRGPDGERSRRGPGKGGRDSRDRRDRRRRDDGTAGDDAEGRGRGSKSRSRRDDSGGGADRGDRRSDRRDRRSDDRRSDRSDRRNRRSDERRSDRRDRRSDDRRSDRRDRRSDDRRSDRRDRRSGERGGKDGTRSDRPARPRTPGLKAKRVHRQEALEALPADQQPLAREVLRAGVPGVRKSIERMNAKAAAEKLPQIKQAPILALAEKLAPGLKAAEWHDRADAALAGMAKVDLRAIRSVIAAADRAARTEETRALAESLRAGLAQRLETDHRQWLDELASTIAEGRTIRALRLSSRPPKAGAPLPADMAERLANMAAADLNPTGNQQRWSTVVESVALSPVRTQVVPLGAPDKPSEDLLSTVRRLADRIPQIAALFGIEPQPPNRGARLPPPPPPDAEASPAPTAEPPADTDTDTAAPTAETPADTDTDTAAPTAEQPADTDTDTAASAAEPAADTDTDATASAAEPAADTDTDEAAPTAEPAADTEASVARDGA